VVSFADGGPSEKVKGGTGGMDAEAGSGRPITSIGSFGRGMVALNDLLRPGVTRIEVEVGASDSFRVMLGEVILRDA
jgi:hypothetical protein